MLSEYGRKDVTFGTRMIRILLFAAATVLFIGIIALLTYLAQVPSVEQKREIEEENRLSKEFSRNLEIAVLDAGYLERQTPERLIYVPVVLIEIHNCSKEPLPAVEIHSSFSMKTTHICAGAVTVRDFLSGERQQLRLSCSESVMFGTVITGIGKDQTRNSLEYSVRIGAGGVFAPTLTGKIEYKLFRP